MRSGQAEIGVVLPEGGLKAGEKNTIQLSSLNYSTEGEPMAQTVTLKIGDTEVTADISNETTEQTPVSARSAAPPWRSIFPRRQRVTRP